jgi:two-component system, NtrC family, nitrogen regulation response regulator GlnG
LNETAPRSVTAERPIEAWIVDDDASIRWVLEQALRSAGMRARSFERAGAFDAALRERIPDVVISDIRMPDADGFELLSRLHEAHPGLPVIVVTAYSDLDSAVSAYRGGAFEYLPKPFDVDHAVELVRRAASTPRPASAARSERKREPPLLGSAPSMQDVFRAIGRLARSSMTVLITGESGTGKELVAAALHRHSPRASGPFIALNTSAIPPDLLESELFGHERGAFTGAQARREGRFEQAHGGTLFLDEIGDMAAPLQTRLLRVLAEGEFYRVGGQEPIRVDVRVVAATNQDLDARVHDGGFREDLFHRLNVFRIRVPPLRERREDIGLLLAHYLGEAAGELGVAPKSLAPDAEQCLLAFDWPGNVRQLVNACRRLTLLAPGERIELRDLPVDLGGADNVGRAPTWSAALAQWAQARLAAGSGGLLLDAVPELERTLIRLALEHTGGRRQEAARILGLGRNTLTRKLRSLGLD